MTDKTAKSWFTKPVFGFVMYDFANSAFATTVLAVIFNRYFAEVIAGGSTGTVFSIFGKEIVVPGAAAWNYVIAFSMIFVAFSSPILGAIADIGKLRLKLLAWYCLIGVSATIALRWVGKGELLAGAIIFTFANIGFAGGNVFYNAYLPSISKPEDYGKISGLSWGIGYLGGGLCLILNLIMLQKPELLGFPAGYFDVGDTILVAGVWWGLFSIPTLLFIDTKKKTGSESAESIPIIVKQGWKQVGNTLRNVRKFPDLFKFLISYLFFNDGIETVIITASIFGAEVVGLGTSELVLFFIMIQGMGFVGSMIFGWVADRLGSKFTLQITIGIWTFIVIWAYYLGIFYSIRTEFYLLGILAGLVMGGSQAAARSLQALFTPATHSAEFFGFFSLSGKFANVFGTAIYGTAIVIAGGLQSAILVLGVFFIVGGGLLFTVNENRGMRDAAISLSGSRN